MSENEYSPAGRRPVECFPANNLERWSPIPKVDRVAVKRALAGLRAPMGDGPLQRAVTALGAAHKHLVRSTLAGYVEMGLWLYTLWTHTPTRQWLRCFSDSPNPITHPLPLSRQQAEAFMRLAREPAVLDQANWSRLPRGWTIMDTILRAAKQRRQSVQAMIDNGTIYPTMTRTEARALAARDQPWSFKAEAATLDAVLIRALDRCPLKDVEEFLAKHLGTVKMFQDLYRGALDEGDRAALLRMRKALAALPGRSDPRFHRFDEAWPLPGWKGGGLVVAFPRILFTREQAAEQIVVIDRLLDGRPTGHLGRELILTARNECWRT